MDPGFRQDGVMTIQLDLRKANLTEEARPAVIGAIVDRVRAIPGVSAAAQTFTTPVSGNFWNQNVIVDGKVQTEISNFNSVGPGYFDALGIQFVAGRDFDARDTLTSPNVAIVTESFARTYLGGRNPIGQSFQLENAIGEARPFYEIVGVIKDTKYTDLREPFAPLAHLAYTQALPPPFLQVVARIDTAPAAFTAAATRAIGEVNPSISLQYQSVRTQLAQSLLQERLMATLSSVFAGLAVLIATVGLYGVMSYMVARRRVEIGVRMALGADAGAVVRMIVGEAGMLLAGGLVIGTVLAVFASRSAAALLYNLTPNDPATVAMAIVALASVTLLAGWIPARRASRLPPTAALRED
jgi:predicted permease